jgi:uncharacterized membrane protein
MRWDGWNDPPLRRWVGTGVVLLLLGLTLHLIGGAALDPAWLGLTIVAAIVLVVGMYRHQEPPEG